MPVDTSIYGNLLRPAPSLMDNLSALDAADLQRTQLAGAKVNLIGAQQTQADQQAYRDLARRVDTSKPENLPQIFAISPTIGAQAAKSQADIAKSTAEVGHLGAQTDQALAAAQKTRTEHAIAVQAQIAQAAGAATDQASWDRGLQIAETLGADVSKVPKIFDPATAKQIHDQALTGAQQLDTHFKEMAATEANRHNKASEADTRRGQDLTAGSAAAGRSVQLKLGGYDENGNLMGMGAPAGPGSPAAGSPAGGSPFAGLVDAIGAYKTPEGIALSRIPPGIKSQVLAAVMQKYPDYDPSTFGAKQKAARDFTSGSQGNALRSFSVAGQHLDQLGTLVDALGNGQYQIVNKIGNAYAAQTGATAPTNFDAAKDVVSKEVVKAIVAGGGGVAEREELSKLMSNAKSPAQLKGVISQYRGLMSAQHDALLQQRRGAGLPDSTLPEYSRAPAAPAGLPDDIAAILKKHGG